MQPRHLNAARGQRSPPGSLTLDDATVLAAAQADPDDFVDGLRRRPGQQPLAA